MSHPTSLGSVNTRARQKRYHRRSPRACDECRLRKCKCDGFSPCGPCRLTGNNCTYDPKAVPVQKPTLRVRELEARLRSIRDIVQQLRRNSSQDGFGGMPSELTALEEAVGLSSPAQFSPAAQVPTPRSDESDSRLLLSMMGTAARKVVHGTNYENSYGPISIVSFVSRILELFQSSSAAEYDEVAAQRTMGSLFDAAMLSKEEINASSSAEQFPDEENFLLFLDDAFKHCQPLGRLFHLSELRDAVIQFYQPEPSQYTVSPSCLYPLLHAVLSLGRLFDSERHRHNGCSTEFRAAMGHFYMAAEHIDDIQDPSIIGIQTLLCMVIFLLNSSQMGKAHRYLGMACSAAIRLGLPTSTYLKTSHKQRALEIRIYSLLLEFDTYISILLDLPQALNVQDPELFQVANAGSRLDTSRGINIEQSSSNDEIEVELSKTHMHLMVITSKALREAFYVSGVATTNEIDGTRTALVDERVIREADANFRAWVQQLSPLIAKLDSSQHVQRFRPRLETTFYLSQLALYFPFLHYLIPSNTNKSIHSQQSQVALSCIKVASTTILRFSNLYETGNLLPICWTTVHAIFVAVLCLIFLIAAHEGTSRPGEAWRRAELGIRLLASMRCAGRGAGACLDIIKLLITRLKHTVDFDMEHIEATTHRICNMDVRSINASKTARQTVSTSQVTSQSRIRPQHRPSFTIQDLLIPDPPDTTLNHTPSQLTPVRTGFPTLHRSVPPMAFQNTTPAMQSQSSATSPNLLTQQAQFMAQLPNASTWAMSLSGLTSAASADADSPASLGSSILEHSLSLSTNADGILAQAQKSAHIIDFDMLLDLSSS